MLCFWNGFSGSLLYAYVTYVGMSMCFSLLKGTICSCHLKDIRLKEEYTFQLEETSCGSGILDLELYAALADAENPCMPMIIEHLDSDEEYISSVAYVRSRLGQF